MKPSLLALALATTLALAACQRDAEPAPAATPEPAAEAPAAATDPVAATDATEVAPSPPTADAGAFDTKGFAGEFGATGTSLEIAGDGTYRLREQAESAGADLETAGTWTAEANGKHLLLDPHSKAEPDRHYEIVSHDELRAADGSHSLRRMEPGK
jgi:copper homeostasis protein (lipoprotein)